MPPICRYACTDDESKRNQILPKHRKRFAELACDDSPHLPRRHMRHYLNGCIVVQDEIRNERQQYTHPPRKHGGNVDQVFEYTLFSLSGHEVFSSSLTVKHSDINNAA